MHDVYHVLFLSQRNSARSIMAEAVLNKIGEGRFRASSAGVRPIAGTDPVALEVLRDGGYRVDGLKPKHFDEFARTGASDLDFVFTLSDTAAGESLPEWPGLPVTAHWASSDPVQTSGLDWERRQVYARTLGELERRLAIFVNLPFGALDRMSLSAKLSEIAQDGQTAPAASKE